MFFNPLNKKASFLSWWERRKVLNSSNKGLVLNGSNLKLSENDSFTHLALFARTGGGKTTSFIIPNILNRDNASMVITDPSGEIYKLTSGYLAQKGYKIKVINPTNLEQSLKYNPLSNANTHEEISEISKILIKSANPSTNPSDEFWLSGAEKILTIIIKSLKNSPKKEFINLANVKHLLNSFGAKLDDFIAKYADEITFNEYKGFLSGNEKTIQSFLSTAQISLNALSNPQIAKLLQSNEIEFKSLRDEKTALFITIPEQKISYYSFLLNLLYTQLFNFCMEIPKDELKDKLPIYFLLDEFGHLAIPNFSSIITTIRKFKVSISIILQSMSQLETKYGRTEAETILNGGINSKVFFSGADLNTTQMLEKILGRTITEQTNSKGYTQTKEKNLLNASSIRTLE